METNEHIDFEFTDIQNKYIIFCDASIKKYNDIHYTCAGAICPNVYNKPSVCIISADETNNRGELLAIYKALELGRGLCMTYGYKPLLILSDSQFGVCGLRDWMPSWIDKRVGETIYSTNNKPVKNQDLFKAILNFIRTNGLDVYLRHISGHVNINEIKSIKKACKVFRNINRDNNFNVHDIVRYCKYNNDIDAITRCMLESADLSTIPIVNATKVVMCDYMIGDDWKGLIK